MRRRSRFGMTTYQKWDHLGVILNVFQDLLEYAVWRSY